MKVCVECKRSEGETEFYAQIQKHKGKEYRYLMQPCKECRKRAKKEIGFDVEGLGISISEYWGMMTEQGNACDICEDDTIILNCISNGKLICEECNTMLWKFRENQRYFEKLAEHVSSKR